MYAAIILQQRYKKELPKTELQREMNMVFTHAKHLLQEEVEELSEDTANFFQDDSNVDMIYRKNSRSHTNGDSLKKDRILPSEGNRQLFSEKRSNFTTPLKRFRQNFISVLSALKF